MEQLIRFCTTADGARIAYALIGGGPVLIYPPRWVGHLEVDWEDSSFRAFVEALAARHTVVRYDRWGAGLSDRERTDLSLGSELRTLTAVIDHLGAGRIALLGQSAGGPPCVAFAAHCPARVSHLVLFGTWARREPVERELREAVTALIHAHWGVGSRTLADMFMPQADAETRGRFSRLQLAGAAPEMAVRLRDFSSTADVADLAPRVRAPTLVLHRHDDQVVPFALGRDLAARISGARLIPLDGDAHAPWMGDTATVLQAMTRFLAEPSTISEQDTAAATGAADHSLLASHDLSARELEVLRRLAAGKSNPEIAEALVISLNTVYRHVNHIFNKLGVENRVEAATYAQRHGLV